MDKQFIIQTNCFLFFYIKFPNFIFNDIYKENKILLQNNCKTVYLNIIIIITKNQDELEKLNVLLNLNTFNFNVV